MTNNSPSDNPSEPQADTGPMEPTGEQSKDIRKTLPGRASSSALQSEAERLQAAAMTQARQRDQPGTERFKPDMLHGLPEVGSLPFGTEVGGALIYRKIPASLASAEVPEDVPRWRVEFEGVAPGVDVLGFDILGDSVVGRGRVGDQAADFDLDMFGGLEKGVSRRHALLRPTANHLYVIDLGSTNGTMHNGLPLGPGIARSLKHNDTVSFGKLSMTIKIIDGPGMHKKEQPQAYPDQAERTRELNEPHPGDPTGVASFRRAEDSDDEPLPGTDNLES